MSKRKGFKLIAWILLISIVFSNIFACSNVSNLGDNTSNTPNNNEITENPNNGSGQPSGDPTVTPPSGDDGEIENLGSAIISDDWKDYVGDLETFVYGLLTIKLEYIYDVFPAYIQLSSGYFVYGLGYTDYSECYTDEDENVAYFSSGFISFAGELDIPNEDFDTGLILYNLEYQDEETIFLLKYKSDAFLEHCVVYDTYLQYGVDSNGSITFEGMPFEREKCDTSLGSLYSYDESRYLYDVDFGNYMPISGESLSIELDYDQFEEEVNAFIQEQNANWMTYDVETIAYTSQEAVVAYFLSLQEETFFGYPVEQLIELSQELDPMQCFRTTPEGLSVIDIQETPPEGASELCKWLVGTACVIAIAVGVVGSMVFAACPPLSSLSGAMVGLGIELFMQVVIENKTLSDVSWLKVGIAAVSGAVSGFVGPYLQTLNGAAYFFIDSAVDGIVAGIESAAFAFIDGAEGTEILKKFGDGFIFGACVSAGFKVVGKIISKIGTGLSAGAQKVFEKLSPKMQNAISKFTKPLKNLGNAIGDGIQKLKQKADSSVFYSKFIGKKTYEKVLANLTQEQREELFELCVGKGTMQADRVMDANGNYFSKQTLKDTFNIAKNGDIVGYINEGGIDIPVRKYGNALSIDPSDIFPTVKLKNKEYNKYDITSIRKENLNESRELLREFFIKNTDRISESLLDAIKSKFPDTDVVEALKQMNPTTLKKVLEASGNLHENLNGTVTFMPKEIHSKIGHMGGAKLEAWIKQHMGAIYFESFISAASSGAALGGTNG